jgi:hypothetical protein
MSSFVEAHHCRLALQLPSSTTIELSIVSSAYHIELNPSDAGYHDRLVVQEVIKEIAQSPPLDTTNKPPFKGTFSSLPIHF